MIAWGEVPERKNVLRPQNIYMHTIYIYIYKGRTGDSVTAIGFGVFRVGDTHGRNLEQVRCIDSSFLFFS